MGVSARPEAREFGRAALGFGPAGSLHASPVRTRGKTPADTLRCNSHVAGSAVQFTAAFVCLHCRKVFKRPSHRRVGESYQALDYTPSCPQCQTDLLRVGDAFRAPPKDDLLAWERVERDISRGRTFVRDEGFG